MDCDETLLWKPKDLNITNIGRFIETVNRKYDLKIENYSELYQWSITEVALFWETVWDFCGVLSSKPYDRVLETEKNIDDIPKWFEGAELSYAEHVLRWNDDKVAIYAAREGADEVTRVTYKQLNVLVNKYVTALQRAGVMTGDRVVGYIPNCPEAIAAMLAVSSLGAIWSSTSPDFGVSGVLDRFSQIAPKIIFSVNGVKYNGKLHSHIDKITKVVNGLPDIEKVVIIKYVDVEADISGIRNSCWLDDFLESVDDADIAEPMSCKQLPFSHPLYIMYSSGTTGAPKCIVHSQGGTLLKHFEEHVLQGNASREDVMLYYTTTGWMMWNWLVGILTVGASVVLYDGSPLVPDANVLWDIVDNIGVTILGTSAKWLSVLEDRGVEPGQTHRLTSLHTILSTGSPLKPESYRYVYKSIKSDLLLGSITGGTDIIGCFAGQNPTVPVYCGEIQSRNLGCAMECWSDDGQPVYGERGELICTKPFPSMPVFFWNDPEGLKYKKAYFCKYKGVWSHGDYCMINPNTGGIWMLGRSDGVLNPNGVRFGSAEIYNIVEGFKEVEDSVCVAQRNQSQTEERVLLFVKMAAGCTFSEDLVKRLKTTTRQLLSARHVPQIILEIKDIPYTISGKKVEVAVREVIAGRPVAYEAAFSNPESLNLYRNLSELQGY